MNESDTCFFWRPCLCGHVWTPQVRPTPTPPPHFPPPLRLGRHRFGGRGGGGERTPTCACPLSGAAAEAPNPRRSSPGAEE